MEERKIELLQELNSEKQELESKGEKLSAEKLKQWESLTMLKAIEEQKANVTKQDEAFFGWMAPEETRGDIIQQAITNQVPVSKEKDEETISYSPLIHMNDLNKRYSMVIMYALTQEMSLEEVLSDDPQYDERKEEIGKTFIESLKFEDKKAYVDRKKDEYLANEKNADHIENMCKMWMEAIKKDGLQAKRPAKMRGSSDMITFFGERCKEYWEKSQSGSQPLSESDFIQNMRTEGKRTFADQRDFGANYFGYLNEHNQKISGMLQEMHDAFAKIPADFMHKTDIPDLAQNMTQIALISEASTNLELCRHENLLEVTYDEEENTNELDARENLTEDIRQIGIIKSYCDYIASDAYTLNEYATKAEYERIQEGYWAKLQMDAIADRCKEKETLGEVGRELHTYNAGGIVDKKKKEFQDAMMSASLADGMWAAKANDYIGTGKMKEAVKADESEMEEEPEIEEDEPEMENKGPVVRTRKPVISEDDFVIQQAKMVQEQFLSQAKTEPELSQEEDWRDFETFDLNEDKTVNMASVRTMSWKELEAEEKQAKSGSKKQTVSTPMKSVEKKKEKEAPKLGKK